MQQLFAAGNRAYLLIVNRGLDILALKTSSDTPPMPYSKQKTADAEHRRFETL